MQSWRWHNLPGLMQGISDQQDFLDVWCRLPGAAERCLVITIAAKSLNGHEGQHLLSLIQNDLRGHLTCPGTKLGALSGLKRCAAMGVETRARHSQSAKPVCLRHLSAQLAMRWDAVSRMPPQGHLMQGKVYNCITKHSEVRHLKAIDQLWNCRDPREDQPEAHKNFLLLAHIQIFLEYMLRVVHFCE